MSVEAVGALREPVRRAVYDYTAGRGEPVGRDEVAEAVGIGRTLAAFHLDRLAEAGLLEVSYARRSGRTGPGAGRPAKLYRRAVTELEVSLPPRRYRSVAGLLAEAVDRAGADGLLFDAARRQGRSVGRAAGGAGLVEVLTGQGYEPRPREGAILLGNCPFHTLARDHPPLICGMNLALLQGLLEGLGLPGEAARIAPGTDGCCVVIERGARDRDSKNNDG
jgi:predicted ArsR family transcriptional regulator